MKSAYHTASLVCFGTLELTPTNIFARGLRTVLETLDRRSWSSLHTDPVSKFDANGCCVAVGRGCLWFWCCGVVFSLQILEPRDSCLNARLPPAPSTKSRRKLPEEEESILFCGPFGLGGERSRCCARLFFFPEALRNFRCTHHQTNIEKGPPTYHL